MTVLVIMDIEKVLSIFDNNEDSLSYVHPSSFPNNIKSYIKECSL